MLKTINLRYREAFDYAASARQFKEQVQEGLERRLRAHLRDGEVLPGLAFFQELLGRLLEESGNGVLELDASYNNQMVGAAALRDERDRLATQLRTRLQQVRFLVDSSIGGNAAKTALRYRRLSYLKPSLLVAAARDLAVVLRDPKHSWEETEDGNTAVFAAAQKVATTLDTDADALEQVLQQLAPQSKAKQDEQGTKTAEVEAVADTNRRCKDALYGLYRLAGLDFHAERLRPKVRRRKAGDPDPTEPNPSPPAAVTVH